MSSELLSRLSETMGTVDISSPPEVDRLVAEADRRQRRQRSWIVGAAVAGCLVLIGLLANLRGTGSFVASTTAEAAPGAPPARTPLSFLDVVPTLIADAWLRTFLVALLAGGLAAGASRLRKRRVARPLPDWGKVALTMLGSLIVLIVGFRLSTQIYFAPSQSMEPAIMVGSRFVVATHDTDVVAGDVVVYQVPAGVAGRSELHDLVKRVIGVGGDTVQAIDGQLLVNDVPSAALWIDPAIPIRDFGPIDVPVNEFFMMGDNYPRSRDSRSHGTVARSELVGTVRWATNSWSG